MRVINEIRLLEPLEDNLDENEEIYVESHWNYSDRIILKFKSFVLTVPVQELKLAIDNATNHS